MTANFGKEYVPYLSIGDIQLLWLEKVVINKVTGVNYNTFVR